MAAPALRSALAPASVATAGPSLVIVPGVPAAAIALSFPAAEMIAGRSTSVRSGDLRGNGWRRRRSLNLANSCYRAVAADLPPIAFEDNPQPNDRRRRTPA